MNTKNKEIAKRRNLIESVIADFKIEGFIFTPDELKKFERFIKGDITTDEMRNEYMKEIEKDKINKPELFLNEVGKK